MTKNLFRMNKTGHDELTQMNLKGVNTNQKRENIVEILSQIKDHVGGVWVNLQKKQIVTKQLHTTKIDYI